VARQMLSDQARGRLKPSTATTGARAEDRIVTCTYSPQPHDKAATEEEPTRPPGRMPEMPRHGGSGP
jgi:hypothetical protein